MDTANIFSGFEQAIHGISMDEREEMKKQREILALAARNEWVRPFVALATMDPQRRDLIRQTLKFDWATLTIKVEEKRRRAQFEAWEIIDCHIRGIAARLHTVAEQLNPVCYITWRQALIRVLELAHQHYKATDTQEELEKLVLDTFHENRRTQGRRQTEVPNFGVPKSGKAGLILNILKDVAEIWDKLLGSEDGPAVAAVYALCETLQLSAAAGADGSR